MVQVQVVSREHRNLWVVIQDYYGLVLDVEVVLSDFLNSLYDICGFFSNNSFIVLCFIITRFLGIFWVNEKFAILP